MAYPGLGALFSATPGTGAPFTGVIDGTFAQQAGLFDGDEILSVDRSPFAPVPSFRDKVGKQVDLSVRRAGELVSISVTPVDIEPGKMFLDGLNASARIVQANGRHIGYVHVWSYASRRYQHALEQLISEGPLREPTR